MSQQHLLRSLKETVLKVQAARVLMTRAIGLPPSERDCVVYVLFDDAIVLFTSCSTTRLC